MYRILIADDEGIMLESLKSIILKNFDGQCEVTTVRSGRMAIEQSELIRPDIVFMDIQMPGIKGIDAMKEIRRFNQTTLFYVISAYDKFDYAKQAIAMGVERYLTKPVTKTTVIEVVREAMEKVDRNRRTLSDKLKVQEKLETVIPVVENSFIGNILLRSGVQNVDYYRQLLDISAEHAFIVTFEFGTEMQEDRMIAPVGINIKAKEFYPSFRAVVKSYLDCAIGEVIANRIVVAIPTDEEPTYERRIAVIENMRAIIKHLNERLDMKFRAGIGRAHSMEDLYDSYQESVQALTNGKSSVVHFSDASAHGEYEDDFPVDLERKLLAALEAGDEEESKACANRFFDWMTGRHPDSQDNIRLKVLEYVLDAEKLAFKAGAVNYGFESRNNYLTEVVAISDYEQLRSWFLHKIELATSRISNQTEEQQESVSSKAISYIKANYQNDISLDEVSRQANVSPYYFSRLFKEETGQTFIEYLTTYRVDKAKKLLEDDRLSIKDISMQVGYPDPNYFSRLFKKQTELTPREYREKK